MGKWKGTVEVMVDKVAVIISAQNRIEALEKCIRSLTKQTYQNCELYIVDGRHQSEKIDNLLKHYRKFFSHIDYVEREWNGQGNAFYAGIKRACKGSKYSHIWLLCDCTQVKEDALEVLVKMDTLLSGKYGFLSSTVLCGEELYFKSAPVIRDYDVWNQYKAMEQKLFPIQYASFEGLFLTWDVIQRIGLPALNMKTGYDGYEYTNRIRKECAGYYVVESQCIHECKCNLGYDVAREDINRVPLYKYVYRNDLYLARKEDIQHVGFYFFHTLKDIIKVIKLSENKRCLRIWQIIAGTISGIIFQPRIEKAGNK